MKKEVFFGLISVGIVAAILIARTSRTNLDNDSEFKPFIGKSWKTKIDLIAMEIDGNKNALVLAKPESSGVPALKDIPAQLPAKYDGGVIHGVFSAGGVFQITHIERVKSFEFTFVDFYATVTSEGNFKGQKVDVGGLTIQNPSAPTFNQKYLEEITPAK
jgi:hypothetical protein